MDFQALKKPLTAKEIDFRVQSINKGGYATILAYKDARADMNRLDDVCTPLWWKREHKLVWQNLHCIVSVYNEKIGEWVSKEDVGVESMAEKAKGEASDSFKRACFNWGIGRELYDYPVISIKLEVNTEKPEYGEFTIWTDGKAKQWYGLKMREWKWASEFDSDGKLIALAAQDDKWKVRFKHWNFNK